MSTTRAPHDWSNWAGLAHAQVSEVLSPPDAAAVQEAVTRARDAGRRVKMVGTGHSFTDISAPQDVMLRPDRMGGIVSVDREAMTATALAGTPLKVLNASLAEMGLSLHNMGDIDEQTLAGATATGTHGTGGVAAGLAAQIAGLELVTGTGELLRANAQENPDVFEVARVGLGALGILTTITFKVEPLFLLEAHEQPMEWSRLVSEYDDLAADCHHLDVFWFPHTDRAMVKQNRRLAADVSEAEPPSRFAAWWEDEFISNTVLGLMCNLTNRAPSTIPTFNQIAGRALSERRYSDIAHQVFTSPRRVVFREMEYAVPREVGIEVLKECRKALDASDWKINFPVEIRNAPADDIPLSTANEQDSFYLAFHTHGDADHTAYFAGIEEILKAHGGRPHWGKLHTRDADELRGVYPRFEQFLAMRDRLDPDRVFANPYLERVLGA
ncbi:MAG: D-arabinono-1,4-lactone oxidase [Nocardioides sp.]|uniref:D-arabinono-1,4-lactone oxidase n=1 Tax=Nocardioides sp. TaxID=35761 RepID=UPI003F095218